MRNNLKREIVVALVLKAILLTTLWWAFFSERPDRHTVATELARQFDDSRTPPADFPQAKKETTP